MADSNPKLSRWAYVMKLNEEARRARPWAYPPRDPKVLVIEEVAGILRCTVDQVRRIPRDRLAPRQGPGKRALYLREDVDTYVDQLSIRSGRIDRSRTTYPAKLPTASKGNSAVKVDLDAALRSISKAGG